MSPGIRWISEMDDIAAQVRMIKKSEKNQSLFFLFSRSFLLYLTAIRTASYIKKKFI